MKKNFIFSAAGALSLLMVAGCGVVSPEPIADPNKEALTVPVSYYGDIELFDVKSTPLTALVISAGADEMSAAETLRNTLNKSNIISVSHEQPYDILIKTNSACQQLTSAPQCRLSHVLSISATVSDGTKLLPSWKHKTETLQAYPTLAAAKEKMAPQIKESIKQWETNYFRNKTENSLKASVVRFKMSRKLIELNPIQFEKDLRNVLNKLHKIDGIINVRIIEADKEKRIASFRILHKADTDINNEIQKQEQD